MAIANVTLDGVAAITETTIFTAAADTAVTVLYICNNDTITRTLDVHIKPAGEGIADENKIYDALSIPAGDTYVMDMEKLILADTDVISALMLEVDTTNTVVVTISTIGI